MRLKPFAKAIALIMWADEKVTEQELALSKEIFEKYGISWADAKPVLEGYIESFLDPGEEAMAADEEGEFVESVEDFELGCLDFGEDVDFHEVVKDLCRFAVLDKKIEYKEIEIIHNIAEACRLDKVLATASLLSAAKESQSELCFE